MQTTLSPILEPLLKSSALPEYAKQINSYLEAERRKREAFYDWITEDIKAEFIYGEIIVQSPAKDRHTAASMALSTLMACYVDAHDLGLVRAETTLVTLPRNDYLPDVCFFLTEKAAKIVPDQMKYPAPDFVAEILSPSTEEKDREIKFDDYEAQGVREYWLVDPERQFVEQYVLRDGKYELLSKSIRGLVVSEVIDGFEIPVAAIFDVKAKNRALAAMLSS